MTFTKNEEGIFTSTNLNQYCLFKNSEFNFCEICGEQYNRQQLRLTWITSSEPETTKQSSRMLSPLRNIKSPGAEWIMSKFTAKALQGKQSILIIMSTCHTILPSKLWTKTQFELFFPSKLSCKTFETLQKTLRSIILFSLSFWTTDKHCSLPWEIGLIPPCVDSIYTLSVDKNRHFWPPPSCPRSYWMPPYSLLITHWSIQLWFISY